MEHSDFLYMEKDLPRCMIMFRKRKALNRKNRSLIPFQNRINCKDIWQSLHK